MLEQKYDWLRFWSPRDAKVKVNGYGALEDPLAPYGHVINPEARTLDTLSELHCLALLGEPGTGKSEEFKKQVKAFPQTHPTDIVSAFQLRDFQTDLKLCRDIFDENPKIQAWLNGNQRLYLYLDSLDEGLLTVTTLAPLLVHELKKFPAGRLYVRIACRTAEWPESLSSGLQSIWGEDGVKAYELLPVREKDIEEAARSEQIDPRAFLDELNRRNVGPFAIKPITLKFLLKIFKENTSLPQSQTELYALGCRYLCEEFNQSRRDSRHTVLLDTTQLLRVAQRIAAISIFSNRSAIWTGPFSSDIPSGDIIVADLTGGAEGADSDRFHIGEAEIRETLRTGLFTSRGPHRMGWAHQTYAEFLAAQYLTEHQVPFSQKVALLSPSGAPGGNLVPQLRETAAWLASVDKEIFQHILAVDPTILLRTDVASQDVEQLSALVGRLLESAHNDEWFDRDWSVHRSYSKLKHPQLGNQLSSYIRDKSKSFFARRFAADVAEACDVHELQTALVEVALDQAEDMNLRINAAYAVNRIADTETKGKLKPLAFGTSGDDPDDELKGRGLRALWPHHLTSPQLFLLLTFPKRPSMYGSYKSFLGALAREADTLDLIIALRWIRDQHIHPDSGSPFRSLRNEILCRAWRQADDPNVRAVLTDLVMDNARKLVGDENEKFAIDDDKRRQVLSSVLQRMSQEIKPSWYQLAYEHLVQPADVPWLLERIPSEESSQAQQLFAAIINRMLDWHNVDHVGQVIEASKRCSALADTFSFFLNPVYLDSEQADMQRRVHAETLNPEREIAIPPPLTPPAGERVRMALERFEAGETAAWWQLNLQLTVREDGYCDDEYESDLTKLSGWEANPEIGERLVEGAKRYLLEGDPEAKKWVRKNIMYRPAYAGYRAFRLLLDRCPDQLLVMPIEVWRKWACILVSYPFQSEESEASVQQRLVELASERVPGEIISSILLLIDKENKTDGFVSCLSTLKDCWTDDISRALLHKLRKSRLKHNCFIQVLSELLEHDFLEAKRYAERLVKTKPRTPNEKKRRLTAARLLMSHAADAGWGTLWPKMVKDPIFGREVIESATASVSRRNPSITERLDEVELAELFIWLEHEYPHATDLRHEGVYSASPDDEARSFRDAVLHQLKERGTPQAVSAMRRVVCQLPHLQWLKWTLLEALEANHRNSWIPPKPFEIRRIADDHDSRLVQSGEQLLNVVIESLQRLEEKLHGETPAAIFLWDQLDSGVCKPKDENALSNYVKLHLEADLKARAIVVGREVQIRQNQGSFKGQNTDIHVDAFTRDPNGNVSDRITVIVETKGCWNADLDRAMETQLKNRYLKNHPSPFGLYLVGWFNREQWSNQDRRKHRSTHSTLQQARDTFEKQAASLSDQDATLKAFVLNVGLPSSAESQRGSAYETAAATAF